MGIRSTRLRIASVGLVAMLAASLPFSLPGRAEDNAVPVIISTDSSTGLRGGWRHHVSDIDDGLAIAMALASPEIDVRGLVVTFGNNLMEPEYGIAKRIVGGMESEVPVVRGAPIALPPVAIELFDGKPLLGSCLNDGVTFMADELKRSARPLVILALGPLTDIACLAENYPDLQAKIENVLVIGGRAPGEALRLGSLNVLDFNLANDIPSVAYLLEKTKIPLQFMTFSLTSSVLVPAAQRKTLCESALPLASEFFCPAVLPFIQQWNRDFGENGFYAWDQNAIFVITTPEAYDCTPAKYEIIDCKTSRCAGHDASHPARLKSESTQIWLADEPAAERITACRSYKPGGKERFLEAIFAFADN